MVVRDRALLLVGVLEGLLVEDGVAEAAPRGWDRELLLGGWSRCVAAMLALGELPLAHGT